MSLKVPQRAFPFSRRRFFRWAGSLAATVGAAPLLSAQAAAAPNPCAPEGEDYYDKLGVEKIINAAGTYTTLTAACMPPVVLAAVPLLDLEVLMLSVLEFFDQS